VRQEISIASRSRVGAKLDSSWEELQAGKDGYTRVTKISNLRARFTWILDPILSDGEKKALQAHS
jgi:hypothetical protein